MHNAATYLSYPSKIQCNAKINASAVIFAFIFRIYLKQSIYMKISVF